MNIFYAPPDQIQEPVLELRDQEATHATRVLRMSEGDAITVVDGEGGWYEGKISRVTREACTVSIEHFEKQPPPDPKLVLGLGIIKKRDRLEFAAEKAVELGVSGIRLFRSEHTVKQNVRVDRLESVMLSAMKQSLRAYRPGVSLYPGLSQLLDSWREGTVLTADQKGMAIGQLPGDAGSPMMLIVGPEGGFSESERERLREHSARMVRLGERRLRTETAAITFLSRFLP